MNCEPRIGKEKIGQSTDPTAINYDATATVDDGSCTSCDIMTLTMNDSWGDGWNGNSWEARDENNSLVASCTIDNGSSGTGTIAAGGTLGVLIPPSIVLIVYGIATGTSIGRLFLSGLIPGFMLAGMFAIWALIHSYFIDKDSAKALKNITPPTFKDKI